MVPVGHPYQTDLLRKETRKVCSDLFDTVASLVLAMEEVMVQGLLVVESVDILWSSAGIEDGEGQKEAQNLTVHSRHGDNDDELEWANMLGLIWRSIRVGCSPSR